MKDWGRSDNDQRHRLVISASVNSPTDPGTTLWERLSHGFQASTMLQYYSALPFNIVSGVNSLQGTAGRPFADGSVVDRQLRRPRGRASSRAMPAPAATSSP